VPGVVGLFCEAEAAHALVHDLLQIRLAHIDHVDGAFGMPKAFGIGLFRIL
jgi:hypothetical protein